MATFTFIIHNVIVKGHKICFQSLECSSLLSSTTAHVYREIVFLNPKSHRVHSGPLCKEFRTSDLQRNVMGQSTEMSPLVSMLFRTFLNPLKFLM